MADGIKEKTAESGTPGLAQGIGKIQASSPNEEGNALLYMLEDLNEMLASVVRGKKEWEDTVDSITDPLFIHDEEHRIVRCNRAYQKLANAASFSDLIGRPYFEVFPKMEAPFRMCLKTAEEDGLEEVTVEAVNKVYKVRSYPLRNTDGGVHNSVHIMEDVTEARLASDRLRHEMDVTSHLLMIAEATARTSDIGLLLQKITECSRKALSADACLIYLYDAEAGAFNPSHSSGIEKEQLPSFVSTPLEHKNPFVKKALETKAPVVLDTAYAEAGKIPKKDARACAYIPLIGRDTALGIIAVLYKNQKTFGETDTRLMAGISHQVSVAVEQAHLYREATERAMELSRNMETVKVMHEIDAEILSTVESREILEAVTRLVARLVQCDRATVALVDAEKEAFIYTAGFGVEFAPKGTVTTFKDTSAAEVLKTGRPEYAADLREFKTLLPIEKKLVEAGYLSHIRVPISLKGEIIAVLTIGSKRPSAYGPGDLSMLEKLASQIGVALENARLVEDLESLFIGTVKSLSAAIDAKSKWTAGHSERVCAFAMKIGSTLGLNAKEMRELELASLLHDIGKIGTYEAILEKPGKLTDEEMAVVKQHPGKGAEILGPIKQLKTVIPAIRYHQECFDGSGYPEGIKGADIPLYARIIAVADTVDAMGADRPYRKGRPWTMITAEIKRCSGTQFDPEVVEAFLKTTGQHG
ncbi:MAG: GAF domain-containing protein [Deltaproteobacteria bacterium]|nr:GAF domain-containing protein [Deltaproteobacteria bacterium]